MHSQSLPEQFLNETKDSPTLCISTCSLDSGGCHSLGKSLADELHHDYVGMCDGLKKASFNEHITKTQYENVYITGCSFIKPNFFNSASQKYDFSKVKNVYIITPPHIVTTPNYEQYNLALNVQYTTKCHHSIKLLTSGITVNHRSSIGLPSPFPAVTQHEQKKVLEDHTLGVVYIRDLILEADSQNVGQAYLFLSQYFLKITRIAIEKGISNPSILILGSDEAEKQIYQMAAKTFKLNLIFKDKLPGDQFISALHETNKKHGVIACNGVQTFIQANLLGCEAVFHANKEQNKDFLRELLGKIPPEYNLVAKEILGLATGFESEKHPDHVKKIYEIIQENLKKGTEKFKQLEQTCHIDTTPIQQPKAPESKDSTRPVLTHLTTITGVNWKYDSKKHMMFFIGNLSVENLEKLKPLNLKKDHVAKSAKLFAGHEIHIITETQENLTLIEEMANPKNDAAKRKMECI